eukprot:3610285-Prymnesium_polylepis.1
MRRSVVVSVPLTVRDEGFDSFHSLIKSCQPRLTCTSTWQWLRRRVVSSLSPVAVRLPPETHSVEMHAPSGLPTIFVVFSRDRSFLPPLGRAAFLASEGLLRLTARTRAGACAQGEASQSRVLPSVMPCDAGEGCAFGRSAGLSSPR